MDHGFSMPNSVLYSSVSFMGGISAEKAACPVLHRKA
jgi:hypothetical protein